MPADSCKDGNINGDHLMKKITTRSLAVTGVLTAVAFVLMLIDFPVPLMPSFIKMDLSDLPELIASFALGPLYGVAVCLFKNLFHLLMSQTAGIGELSNFLLGCAFVLPAGIIYRYKNTFKGAVAAALTGAVTMAAAGILTNYFIVYPLYGSVLGFTTETILDMYRTVLPSVKNLWQALMIFNLPFTLIKGLLNALITFLIYKKLSPILKGKKNEGKS